MSKEDTENRTEEIRKKRFKTFPLALVIATILMATGIIAIVTLSPATLLCIVTIVFGSLAAFMGVAALAGTFMTIADKKYRAFLKATLFSWLFTVILAAIAFLCYWEYLECISVV